MNYLTLDLDNGDLVLSDNSVWKSLHTWLGGGTLYSDYYDASNCGDFWVASSHWISIDSESTYLTFTIEYEFIDAIATDSCLCQIKFDGFEDGGVAVTADSSGLNISTDASKHINCDYSNANIKIDITVNLLTKEITTYIHKDNEPLAKKVNVSNYSFTEFVIQAGSRGDIGYKLPTTTKLLNLSVSDVAVSYSNFPETIDYIDKRGLSKIWTNTKSYITSQLLGKSNTGHTHTKSDVTDLFNSANTWTAQNSYNSDLNLNYASTDVDDIVNSVAGSATLDNFVHMTGNETVNGIKSFPDGVIANVTGSATSATNDGSGNVISTTYGKLGANNTWTGRQTYKDFAILYNSSRLPATLGQLPSENINPLRQYIGYGTNYESSYFIHDTQISTDGMLFYRWTVFNIDHSDNTGMWLQIDPASQDLTKKLVVKASVLPQQTNVHNLGKSDLQWNNVYAKNYYYNGTPWGLDQANVWNTYQTIKGYNFGNEQSPNGRTCLYLTSNRDTVGQSGIYISKFRQNRAQGAMNPADLQFISFDVLENSIRTNGVLRLNITNWNEDGDVPSGAVLFSNLSNAHLGSSLIPWKTLNGINPGALSLPATATTDASGDIVPPSGESSINLSGGANTYTPSNNGWLTLAINCASGNCIIVRQNTSNRETLNYMQGYVPGQTNIFLTLPVLAGVTYYVFLYATSFVMARFALCQGNV